jgi:PadR family transcriptional regulator PadR
MGRKELGEFEHQVLLAILRLGGESYSAPLVLELVERGGREVAHAAVFIVQKRLEEKRYVSSRMEEREEAGTRRARRYFKLQAAGLERLRESRETLQRFWEGVTDVLEEKRR